AMQQKRRIEAPPQWLHRDIKGAAAQPGEAAASLDERAQLGRRLMQGAGCIETRDFTAPPVQAENALIAGDLTADPQDRALRQRRIGMPQRQLRQRPENVALPPEQLPKGRSA